MVIQNHIAYRFLTDENLIFEIIEKTHEGEWEQLLKQKDPEIPSKIHSLYNLLHPDKQAPYVVAESVSEHLELLKIKKNGDHFDWTYFKNLKNQKVTFIMPDNIVIRMVIQDEIIHFFHLKYDVEDRKTGQGHIKWIMYYLNRYTGELCEHFEHDDVKQIEESVYKFLCFFYLADNQEEIISPGKTHGTRKSGKILNNFKFPLTYVSSKWNVTSIRTEGFSVSGHFALRWTGEGRNIPRVVLIEPFEKEGYVRKAKSTQVN